MQKLPQDATWKTRGRSIFTPGFAAPRFAPSFLKHCESKNPTLDLSDISEHHSPPTSQLPASLLDACGQGGQTTRTTLQRKRRKRRKKSAVTTWTMKTTWRALPGQITHARTANYTVRTQEPGRIPGISARPPQLVLRLLLPQQLPSSNSHPTE